MFGRISREKKQDKEINKESLKFIEPSNSLVIKILNDEATDVKEELGITDDRYKELYQLCSENLNNYHKKGRVVVMSEISKKLCHVNELYMSVLIMERIIQGKSGGDPLMGLLAQLLGGGSKEE